MEKRCSECHWYRKEGGGEHCFSGCYENPKHPNWQKWTNYDKILTMSEDELVGLWMTDRFPDDCLPRCADFQDPCEHVNYSCELCPKTFRNWLRSEVSGDAGD